MDEKPDDFEQAARIVEAFAEGKSPEVVELLGEVARAVRDHALDD